MRLFVALDVSEATRTQLDGVRATLQAHLRQVTPPPRVTWVAREAAHVTLRFIGEVSDSVAGRVRDALAAPLPRDPYDLEFTHLGMFPNASRPRVLWMGTGAGASESEHLVRDVAGRLDPIVGRGEERPFRAHLTIARVKEPARFDWRSALARLEVERTISRVDHVTLYASKTGAGGPTYTPLCRTPLTTS